MVRAQVRVSSFISYPLLFLLFSSLFIVVDGASYRCLPLAVARSELRHHIYKCTCCLREIAFAQLKKKSSVNSI